MAKVKVVRSFGPSAVGSREKNERFEYDADKDPHGLVKLGLVEKIEESAPASAAKPSK